MKVLDSNKGIKEDSERKVTCIENLDYRGVFLDAFKKVKTLLYDRYIMEFRYSEGVRFLENDITRTVSSSIRLTIRENDWVTYEVHLDSIIDDYGQLPSDIIGEVINRIEKRLSTPDVVIWQGSNVETVING